MKKVLFLIIFYLIFLPIVTLALVEKSSLIYVTDEAKLLTDDTKNYIIDYSDFLYQTEKIQYYVVTVPSLEGYNLDSYIDFIEESFPLSKKSILIFFSKEERQIQVVLGKELSPIMEEEEIVEYVNTYFMPYFKNGEWDKGFQNGYNAFYKKVCTYYNIDASSMELHSGNELMIKYKYPLLMFLIFLSLFFISVFCNFFKKSYKKKKYFFIDYLKFSGTLFLNIMLLMVVYIIEPWMIAILLAIEILGVVVVFTDYPSETLEEALEKVNADTEKKKKAKK